MINSELLFNIQSTVILIAHRGVFQIANVRKQIINMGAAKTHKKNHATVKYTSLPPKGGIFLDKMEPIFTTHNAVTITKLEDCLIHKLTNN